MAMGLHYHYSCLLWFLTKARVVPMVTGPLGLATSVDLIRNSSAWAREAFQPHSCPHVGDAVYTRRGEYMGHGRSMSDKGILRDILPEKLVFAF